MKMKSKNIFLVLTGMILFASLVQLSSCKSDPTPSPQDVVKKKLLNVTWNIQSVTVDGVDNTSLYSGMTISFTDGTYTTTHGGVVWPSSGTWTFTSADATSFLRDDGIQVDVLATDTNLTLKLNWTKTTLNGGRLASIKGQHTFTFTK